MSNALWDSVAADVVSITNRPELVDVTALGVRQATLRAHGCAQFPRDLVITLVPNADQSQAFTNIVVNTATEFVRFRDTKRVQLLDVNQNALDFPVVELVEVDDIYEPGYQDRGIKKSNIAWLAGTNLNVYTNSGSYGANVTWYQAPDLNPDTYNSWIAQLFADVIIWDAARFVWNRTGNEMKAKEAYQVLYGTPGVPDSIEASLYHMLKSNYLTTAGV
jgi:hypothetical protein